jgi:hypothetical protein
MTKSTAGLPLTIALQIPTYWTPEQAFAVFQRRSGSATRCRSRTNTAITSARPISATKATAIRRSDPRTANAKTAGPANGPFLSTADIPPFMRGSAQPLTHAPLSDYFQNIALSQAVLISYAVP